MAFMSETRFCEFVPYSNDIANMSARIDDFLKGLGYYPRSYKNELGVYANGNYKYIKSSPQKGGFLIEAFVTLVGGHELNLDGIVNLMSKMPCKKAVKKLINFIQSETEISQ